MNEKYSATETQRPQRRIVLVLLSLCTLCLCGKSNSEPATRPATRPTTGPIDLSRDKTLYVVGYAHLDTQWRWTYPLVIRDFIPNTLHRNFDLFEKYPNYIFNFSGSRRYEMMKEYYPKDFEKLKEYIAAGKWFTCGSSVDENDANVPSAESLIRQVLYGNRYFKREFGLESREFMLPDCFGFPAALPSVLAHCGIRGFSTQKLTWGSAVGIPFKVGVWEGVDGQGVIAALDPGSYAGGIKEDLSHSESWLKRIENTGKISEVFADYHYYGTGDRGGAPEESAVEWMEKSVAGDGPVRVISSRAEQMFLDITDAQREKLPRYKGELLLTEHSAGSVTSQSYMKRWNRKNELLADAAERAAVAAMWLGVAPYPSKKLYDAWDLVLGSQMHDMLPGTSLPMCYEFCWNDEVLALNQFAAVLTDSVGAVASQMDTRGYGVPIVVYNPLSIERDDVVEATVPFDGDATVTDAGDNRVLSQISAGRLTFVARVPFVGFAVFHVRPVSAARLNELKVSESSLENELLRVTINNDGDIASVFDKKNNREVLAAPSRLAFLYENPSAFPAWNMDWNDRKNPPRSYVTGPARIEIIERGPVRAMLKVTREAEGSRFVQKISLSSGDDRVIVDNTIDWQTQQRSLKATFPLTVSNPEATYDIQVGALRRGNNDPKKYEVPQHQWMDLTDADGSYGVAILNDSKYGSDKPSDNELRLTLLYTPGTRGGYRDQGTQDIGRHEITYAIAPHAGDHVNGKVAWKAQRLNQPLMAFVSPAHPGPLGKQFSLLKLSSDQVAVQTIKKAEDSDDIIVRLKEVDGAKASDVQMTAASPIVQGRDVDGQEREIALASAHEGVLRIGDIQPYRLRTFAIELGTPSSGMKEQARSQPVAIRYDLDAASTDGNRADGAFDSEGRTLAAEQIPPKIVSEGVEFQMGPTADGQKNALTCRGQTIDSPSGSQRVYLLAAAIDGDQTGTFKIGEKSIDQRVQDWGGYIGQWDNRFWSEENSEFDTDVKGEWSGLVPGYVKRDTVAWFSSHRHHPKDGNEFYHYSYLFKYGFDVPAGSTTLTLPKNDKIRIFAITAASNTHDDVSPAHALYDTLDDRDDESLAATVTPPGGTFNQITQVAVNHPLYWKAGDLRYTLDGKEPTLQSPKYEKPILLSDSAKLRVTQFSDAGKPGRTTIGDFTVNDTTPPQVKTIAAVASLPTMRIDFTEPVRREDAQQVRAYQLKPKIDIASAVASDDGTSVTITLAAPLKANSKYSLNILKLRDISPAGNPIHGAKALPVPLASPVYAAPSINCAGGASEIKVDALPTKAKDAWTINFFVRIEKQLENRTIIAGFGRVQDDDDAVGRYICKFGSGVHFWSRMRDVSSRPRVDLDVGKWQMLTATYDGQALRLFKDGRQTGQREIVLTDDDPVVRIAPLDPWDQKRRFEGEIRNFTIWKTALSPEALQMMNESRPQQ